MLANPFRQAEMLLRRDHTLGTLLDRLSHVRGGTLLVDEAGTGLRLTVAEAADQVAAWAGGVAEVAQPGDVVVIATPNGYEQLLLCLVVSRAGAVPAPVNHQMSGDEIAHVVADSKAVAVLHGADDLPTADPLDKAVPVDPGDVAALFYTSGTTGLPKGVELTHKGLIGGLVAGAVLPAGIRRDEAVMSLPMAHIMGFAAALALACSGVPVRFLPHFNPVDVLDAIEDRRATVFIGVPAMYRMLLDAGAEDRDLKSVRLWISGADAMPADLASAFKRMGASATFPVIGSLGEALFAEGYGMVETGGGVAAKLSPPGLGLGLGSGVGITLPGYRFKVVGEDGTGVGRGQVGELLVKGPGVLRGYRGDAAATAAAMTHDGWLRTGDLARPGPFGTVFFAGRAKDVIKHGGYSVYAVEVEHLLETHPDVAEAAVVGLPDERKGEVPAAVVRLRSGATFDGEALRAWAGEHLSEYKVPVRIVAAEHLPKTGTNKVQRSAALHLLGVEVDEADADEIDVDGG